MEHMLVPVVSRNVVWEFADAFVQLGCSQLYELHTRQREGPGAPFGFVKSQIVSPLRQLNRQHLHHLVAQVVDNLYGDTARRRTGERA